MENTILIAFYSWQGNTRKIAEIISEKTGGTLFEVKPLEPYSTDYGEVVKTAKHEIRSGHLPELKEMIDVSGYSTVFLGTPNWWSTMAPPLATFIEASDLKDKTIVPFLTHGGGGSGTIEKDIASMTESKDVKRGFCVYHKGDSRTESEIDVWLEEIL